MKKYLNYNVEQFVSDEFFQKWIKDNDLETDNWWKGWLQENPHKKEEVTEAREIILSFSLKKEDLFDQKVGYELDRLYARIEQEEDLLRRKTPIWKYGIAAAILLCLLFSGLFVVLQSYSNQSYATNYGEIKSIVLPDGSTAILNANSKITFNKDWAKNAREVWVEGEALFEVKKIKVSKNYKKFSVHSKNLSIEVLGTVFNVNTRRDKTTVLLKEGSVNLVDHQTKDNILMSPGDLVEISGKRKVVTHNVEHNSYTAWKDNELVFDKVELMEIAQLLEENFGYKVIFGNPSIKKRKFSGSNKTNEIDLLLTKISKSNNLDITIHNKTITINNP